MKLSVNELKYDYEEADLKSLATKLPHMRGARSKFIQSLMVSNLLKMQEHLGDPAITLGADPEFILCEKENEDKIVLFSSQYTTDYFGISEAELGADYGLLEFRPEPSTDPEGLVKSIRDLHEEFQETYDNFKILEKEAVKYNHKKARVLEALQEDKDINYGMNRGKDVGVWAANEEIVLGMETATSLSAYDKPVFNQFNDKLFTAGGHIHIGGKLILMLSMEQLRAFVRKLDKEILPLCKSVETKAGRLRRTVYGAPGEFRLKNYGIEYRSPSNAIFWQKNLDSLLEILRKTSNIAKTMM